MNKAGGRASTGKRTLAGERRRMVFLMGAALIALLSGCEACERAEYRLAFHREHWGKPRCSHTWQCKTLVTCPPEQEPKCMAMPDDTSGYCVGCSNFRSVPNPDGGPPVTGACMRNPDGGAPLCGIWNGSRLELVDTDGKLICRMEAGSWLLLDADGKIIGHVDDRWHLLIDVDGGISGR